MKTTVDILKLFEALESVRNENMNEMINWGRCKEKAGRRHDRKQCEFCRTQERYFRWKMKRLNTAMDELALYWERAT